MLNVYDLWLNKTKMQGKKKIRGNHIYVISDFCQLVNVDHFFFRVLLARMENEVALEGLAFR